MRTDRPAAFGHPGAKIVPGLEGREQFRINVALHKAASRVRSIPDCQSLFAEFDADGVEMLHRGLFKPAEMAILEAKCHGGVSAVTSIRGRWTQLCPSFHRLPNDRKAATLIHEALHHAGMSERPPDPQAMTSGEIDRLVQTTCDL